MWNQFFLIFGFLAFFINCRWKFKHSPIVVVKAENVNFLSSRNKTFQMTSNNVTKIWKESRLKSRRQRRDIWQLYGVITCTTSCDPFILKDYGCYCGLGGTGEPVDSIDRCCMLHDYCYHNSPCHQALTYFLPYNWKCIDGRPHCSMPPRWNPAYACSFRLCECDRIFSECLQNYGCPNEKAVCRSDRFRRVWQKFLIKLGIG